MCRRSRFPPPARPAAVVEFYNVDLGHYFLTIEPADVAAIEAGQAGGGWVRTGLTFAAFRQPLAADTYCAGDCGVPVARFYGTPGLGPNSHFFTASQAEVDALRPPAPAGPSSTWRSPSRCPTLPVITASRDFFDWTGLHTQFNYVVPALQAGDVFVQGTAPPGVATSTFGLRVSSASRGAWEEVAR